MQRLAGKDRNIAKEAQIKKLYFNTIEGWNQCDAQKLAAAFDDDGMIIGFDGTHYSGALDIEATVGMIPPGKVKLDPRFMRFM